MKETKNKKPQKRFSILNKGNSKVVVLTKESQGTMYYRAQKGTKY